MSEKELKRQILGTIRINLLQKTDDELLATILRLDRKGLNTQVPHQGFPAWDIADRLYSNGWELSPKQRKALINTTSVYQTNVVYQQARANLTKRRSTHESKSTH